MKNVTITLDEKVAQWARVEAAKAGKSLSRWIGEKLGDDMRRGDAATRSLADWLAAPLWDSAEGPLPTRSELYEQAYDRPGFRRHEYGGLHEGREQSAQSGGGSDLAEPSRRGPSPRDQSSGSE